MEELVLEIHESVGVKMHRLGVCEWEVKLWMASPGPANGAWRVVVENVTGHTCIVHVSAYISSVLRNMDMDMGYRHNPTCTNRPIQHLLFIQSYIVVTLSHIS